MRSVVRTPRKSRQWGITTVNGSIVAATSAGKLLVNLQAGIETQLGVALQNVTASAIRLNVNYRLTSSTEGDDTTVACGIAWVSVSAFIAGATSVPDPSSDLYDWMFHDIRTLTSSRDVTDVDEQVLGSHLVVKNDSMRKQRESSSVLTMIFEATLLQPVSLQVFVGGRVLFLGV